MTPKTTEECYLAHFLYDHFLDAAAVIEATSTRQLQNRAA
jgi:hypothetical protein